MTDILDLIDNALSDYGCGPDAMRWTPDPPPPLPTPGLDRLRMIGREPSAREIYDRYRAIVAPAAPCIAVPSVPAAPFPVTDAFTATFVQPDGPYSVPLPRPVSVPAGSWCLPWIDEHGHAHLAVYRDLGNGARVLDSIDGEPAPPVVVAVSPPEPEPPEHPLLAAIRARRNRNTGPTAVRRAPRKLGPR